MTTVFGTAYDVNLLSQKQLYVLICICTCTCMIIAQCFILDLSRTSWESPRSRDT
eukprot:m.1661079 g.1661079  ORF g.1661079 m.1661079 type:complete len:55 (+) comp123786_c0_seq1:173-337(+)